MKTVLKILAIVLIIISLADFINIQKDKHTSKLENKTSELITAVNSTVLKIVYKSLFNGNTLSSPGLTINISSNTARLFSNLKIKFSDYKTGGYRLNGQVKIRFTGFDPDNKPCYQITYPAGFFIESNGQEYQIFGTETFCFSRGFYSFTDPGDDLLTLSGDLNLRHGQTLLKITDKDIILQNFQPVAGYRTVLSKTLEEQVFSFQNPSTLAGQNFDSLTK